VAADDRDAGAGTSPSTVGRNDRLLTDIASTGRSNTRVTRLTSLWSVSPSAGKLVKRRGTSEGLPETRKSPMSVGVVSRS